MGQAKRRKELGLMPESSVKLRKTARIKGGYMDGMANGALMAMGMAAMIGSKRKLPYLERMNPNA